MKREQKGIRRRVLPFTIATLAAIGGTTFILMDNDGNTPSVPERSRTTLLKGQSALNSWDPTTVPATIYESPTDSRPSMSPPTSVQQMPDDLERVVDPIEEIFDDEFDKCMDNNGGYPPKVFTSPPTTFVPEDGWDGSNLEQITPTTTYSRANTNVGDLCRIFATYKVIDADKSNSAVPKASAATPIPAPESKVTG